MKRQKMLIPTTYFAVLFLIIGTVSGFAVPLDNSQLVVNSTDPINKVITIAPPAEGRGLQLKVNKNDFPSVTLDKYNRIYLTGDVTVDGTMKINGNDLSSTNQSLIMGLLSALFIFMIILSLFFLKRINILQVEIRNISNGGA